MALRSPSVGVTRITALDRETPCRPPSTGALGEGVGGGGGGLHAHVAAWVAPIGGASAAADGADFDGVSGAGDEAVERHGAAVGE